MTKLVPHNYYQTAAVVSGYILHRQNQVWTPTYNFSLDRGTRILYLGTASQLKIEGATDSTHPLFEILWDHRRNALSKFVAIVRHFRPHHSIPPQGLIFEVIHSDRELPISPGDLVLITPNYLPDIAPLPPATSVQQRQPSV